MAKDGPSPGAASAAMGRIWCTPWLASIARRCWPERRSHQDDRSLTVNHAERANQTRLQQPSTCGCRRQDATIW